MLYTIERTMTRWPHCADGRAAVMAPPATRSPPCVDVRAQIRLYHRIDVPLIVEPPCGFDFPVRPWYEPYMLPPWHLATHFVLQSRP
jgi:hypothetical protein